jgi:hypothetical protein
VRLASKFVKSANMDSKSNFYKYSQYTVGIKKNAEFDADFESVEKASRKFTQRKLEGWEFLHTGLKGKKVHIFYTCMLITFLYEPFFTLFSTHLKSASNSTFFDNPYQNVVNKYLPTLNPNARKPVQKTKNLFFMRKSEQLYSNSGFGPTWC